MPPTTGRVKEVITDSPGSNKKKHDKGKGKKLILYVSSSESEQEVQRHHKIKKPRQYPELDDKDLYIIDNTQRRQGYRVMMLSRIRMKNLEMYWIGLFDVIKRIMEITKIK